MYFYLNNYTLYNKMDSRKKKKKLTLKMAGMVLSSDDRKEILSGSVLDAKYEQVRISIPGRRKLDNFSKYYS